MERFKPIMHADLLPVGYPSVLILSLHQCGGSPSTLVSAINLQQHEGVWLQRELQLSISKVRALRRRKCGFAVQLLHLSWGWVEGFAHRSVPGSHVAVFAIYALQC